MFAGDQVLEFEVFFDRERARLFHALCLVTRNRFEAEELAQDAFLAVYERWDRVSGMEDPTGYLYRTAMNAFRSWHRRSALAAKRAVGLTRADDTIEGIEEHDVVVRALAPLSARQRAAVVLIDLMGYSSEEAGRMLGIRASTVRTHTERAHRDLRHGWMVRMSEYTKLFERAGARYKAPGLTTQDLLLRRDRKRRDQRIRAAAVGLAVAIGVGLLGVNLIRSTPSVPADETPRPTPSPSREEEGRPPGAATTVRIDWESVPTVSIDEDAIVDIQTGAVTALPPGIASFRKSGGYAVAPGGAVLLFEASAVGSSDNQIYVADVDGSNVRQLTDAPGGATWGAWSPDGTTIVALVGEGVRAWGRRDVDLVLIDVVTGEATRLASGPGGDFWEPHFSTDGQLILFGRFTKPQGSDTFGIPVDGGDAALVFDELANATFSPDGRTIVYGKSFLIRINTFSYSVWDGRELWLADADGSDPRRLFEEDSHNAGESWSPDGTRIVYSRYHIDEPYRFAVVDVASGTPTFTVVLGSDPSADLAAVWLDDDTLLVDV